MRSAIAFFLVLMAPVAARAAEKPLKTVDHVDLDRYLGRWFEIARYPMWFQRNCAASMAEYSWRDDGCIRVVNTCTRRGRPDRLIDAVGKARIPDPKDTAKLEVSFFGPFWGDYWIIGLDPDYQWAVVSDAKRKNLWILARTTSLPRETLDRILEKVRNQGFDPDRLIWDDHEGSPLPTKE